MRAAANGNQAGGEGRSAVRNNGILSMRKKLFVSVFFLLFAAGAMNSVWAIERQKAEVFVGQDLHLMGQELVSYQLSTGEHTLVLRDRFSMLVGANRFFSDSAVIWLETVTTEFRGRVRVDYKARAYLEGNISVERGRGAGTTDLSQTVIEKGRSMVVQFLVTGEVFVTAETREIADPRGLALYVRALAAVSGIRPELVVKPEAAVPGLPAEKVPPERPPEEVVGAKPVEPSEEVARAEVRFRYPVNIAPAGEGPLQVERGGRGPDGTYIVTVRGRLFVWQKVAYEGRLLELQLLADNAVAYYSEEALGGSEQSRRAGTAEGFADFLASGAVRAIYMSGDVVMSEGQRTIRADEVYYDFEGRKALAVNAVMRNFDAERGIPIYVRASKLRQVADNVFEGESVVLTSSEFYQPQISLTASSVIVTDTTTIDALEGQVSDSSYDVQMRDVRLNVYDRTIFYWPFLRSNLERPDVPLKSVRVGHDNTWGTSVETRWYLSRLLGLQEPEGTDNTLALDYYSKRGVGAGLETDYTTDEYFGRLLGYVIRDTGEDRLGRAGGRRRVRPPRELRGRFRWQHRQFLPYNWQLTTETSYASDRHFIEGYYRSEFNVGKEQETYVHLKRLEDNWAVSLLAKGRINDFVDKLEELPSGEFHLTGQSVFDDMFTLYSDTEVSGLRQRIGSEHEIPISEERFSFVSQRLELYMPILAGAFKMVPFVAGTFGYDDRSGFTRTLVDGSGTGEFGEDTVWLGEGGVRVFTQYWKVYPNVKSRLWDLNQLRHVIKPRLTAVAYTESDSVVEQRDTLNVGISQRLQTKRGPAGAERTVDWMRLDMDFTWVNNSAGAGAGPDRFIWSRPLVPLRVLAAREIFNSDLGSELRRFERFGPRRNYFGADYIWRVSDTSAVLSDMNFDMQSGVVQQLNVGFSHVRWPNLSYYIGSRYLRRVEVLDEKGSNAFTFAVTYVLDPRYTVIFSQQFDFDYGANVQSDITLIRRYHRVYCGLTYSADESLDTHAIMFSIWPQGLPELGMGRRQHMELGGWADY